MASTSNQHHLILNYELDLYWWSYDASKLVLVTCFEALRARASYRYRYAPWSGSSPRMLIVARVASIVNGGMATHGTLDTDIGHKHAAEKPCQASIKKKNCFHDTSRPDGCPSTC
jgi:hypothetical protein